MAFAHFVHFSEEAVDSSVLTQTGCEALDHCVPGNKNKKTYSNKNVEKIIFFV